MIAILLSSLLFIFGLICTFTRIPTRRKFLATWFRSFPDQKTHSRDDLTKASNPTAEIKYFKHSSSHKTDLKNVFAIFDKNNDGHITKKELKESLKNIGIFAADRDVDDMIGKLDSNGDGLIDFNEFCMFFELMSSGNEEQVLKEDENDSDGDLKEAFDVFDGNKDGLITLEELGLVLSSLGFIEGNNVEDCKEMIKKVDADGDGMVNFDEFKKMMKTGIASQIVPVS